LGSNETAFAKVNAYQKSLAGCMSRPIIRELATQTMEKPMKQAAQRAESAEEEQTTSSARPVKTFKQGGVEVSVWRNPGEKGDMYNTTIRNSYKDIDSGEWKETSSFSPTDLAVVSQLSSQAFQAITELKSQSRGR
jgi:phage tail tube protein FII